MKIALCVAGHYRNFDKCFTNLQKFIIDKYACDVFIHSYRTKSYLHDKEVRQYNLPITQKHYEVLNCKEIILEDEQQTNQEKNLITKIQTIKKLFPFKTLNRLLFQLYYLRKRIAALGRISIAYDYIILVRPDLLILDDINFTFDKINVIETCNELSGTPVTPLYRDDIIAGPTTDVKLLFERIYAKCGIVINQTAFVTCPHKVLKQTLPASIEIHKNTRLALLKNDIRLKQAEENGLI